MNFGQAIKAGFSNYVNFSSRAIRSEYWFWVLFTLIGEAVAAGIDAVLFNSSPGGFSPLYSLFGLATVLPSLAVGIRRLHDIDRTGWWLLLALTGVGAFVLIYWACQKGTPGPNRFGPDPFAMLGQISPRPAA